MTFPPLSHFGKLAFCNMLLNKQMNSYWVLPFEDIFLHVLLTNWTVQFWEQTAVQQQEW